MRLKYAVMASCVLGYFSNAYSAPESTTEPQWFTLEINAKTGKTNGQLDWNIASDLTGKNTPNILSELEYSNLDIWKNAIGGRLFIEAGPLKNIYLYTNFAKGIINNGSGRDSDYDKNDRAGEYSRSRSDSTGDDSLDFDMGAGYRWKITPGITLSPMASYSHSRQTVRMENGVQEIVTVGRTPVAGAFKNLNSTYQAIWNGYWLGGEIKFEKESHHFAVQLQYHQMDYHSEANWNLRSSFMHPKSFEQWASGKGSVFALNYAYDLSRSWQFTLDWQRTDYSADNGTDTVYFNDGDKASSRLNKANWKAIGWSAGLQFHF